MLRRVDEAVRLPRFRSGRQRVTARRSAFLPRVTATGTEDAVLAGSGSVVPWFERLAHDGPPGPLPIGWPGGNRLAVSRQRELRPTTRHRPTWVAFLCRRSAVQYYIWVRTLGSTTRASSYIRVVLHLCPHVQHRLSTVSSTAPLDTRTADMPLCPRILSNNDRLMHRRGFMNGLLLCIVLWNAHLGVSAARHAQMHSGVRTLTRTGPG